MILCYYYVPVTSLIRFVGQKQTPHALLSPRTHTHTHTHYTYRRTDFVIIQRRARTILCRFDKKIFKFFDDPVTVDDTAVTQYDTNKGISSS